MNYLKFSIIALSITLLNGCSYFGFGQDKAYVTNESDRALEIPPNLSTPKDSGLLQIPEPEAAHSSQAIVTQVLQKPAHVKLLRDGRNYWIRVAGDRDNIWANLIQFWQETQIELRVKNRAHGIIETSWFSGDDQRFATDTKNKFRLRLEDEENSKRAKALEIYITHYGAIATDIDAEKPTWRARERDHDLEVEFLHQLADYLNRKQTKISASKKQLSSYDISDEKLIIGEEFKQAWRKVGIALEQANILVSDRDRNRGIYFVTEVDFLDNLSATRGPLDRYIFGDKIKQGKPFEIHIKSQKKKSVISIVGETMNSSKKVHILKAIRDHL